MQFIFLLDQRLMVSQFVRFPNWLAETNNLRASSGRKSSARQTKRANRKKVGLWRHNRRMTTPCTMLKGEKDKCRQHCAEHIPIPRSSDRHKTAVANVGRLSAIIEWPPGGTTIHTPKKALCSDVLRLLLSTAARGEWSSLQKRTW